MLITTDVRRTLAPILDMASGIRHMVCSFSQFGEDAVLDALFKRLSHEHGFQPALRTYIDVGANVPVRHSNSYFLYRRGWRGVLVEPVPRSTLSYRLNRRGDTLVRACVGEGEGKVRFYTWFPADVYNTTVDAIARDVEARLGVAPTVLDVPVVSLDAICSTHDVLRNGVGVLFVDVEGGELSVLRSLDFSRVRPYVVVLEVLGNDFAKVTNSQVAAHLLEREYSLYAWANPSLIFLRRDLMAGLHYSK